MTTNQQEKQPKRQPLVRKWIVGLLFFVIFTLFLWPSLNSEFPRLACTYKDMDSSSGRIRSRPYFLYIPLPQHIEETAISKYLTPKADATAKEDWIYMARLSTCLCRARRYPVTMNAMNQLERTWAIYNFTEKAREKTAGQLLEILRAEKFRASKLYFDYLRKLCDQKLDSVDPTQPTTAADIPDDLAEKSIAELKAELKKYQNEQEQL